MTLNQSAISWEELTPQFGEYGKVCRDWCETTKEGHQAYLIRFRDWIEGPGGPLVELKDLDFVMIQLFVNHYVDRHTPHSQKGMFTTLRAFLAFCYWKEIHTQDYSFAVPTVRRRKLDRVPWTLTQEQIDSILDSIDCSQPVGKRDFAILHILKAYGVRGVGVRRLLLSDIFWERDQIRFRAVKGGKELIFPLRNDVGNALVDYLCHTRPQSAAQEVFLTTDPSPRRLEHPRELSAIVGRRIRQAGFEIPAGMRLGSHLFRHSLASRMLDFGTPLTWIAGVLGHRNLNSTFIYTKIDHGKLAEVALEWPAEVQL